MEQFARCGKLHISRSIEKITENYKMLISKAVTEDTGENSQKSHQKKASGACEKNKAPLVVSGVVAKKPRKAIDEWIHTTRQRDILKRQFPEYDYLKRNRHLRKLWYDLLDAEKAHISRSIEKIMRIIKC